MLTAAEFTLLLSLSALPSFHTVAVNLNTEIMAALCHNMTFSPSSITATLKITGNQKVASHRGHATIPLIPTTLVPVCFDYPVTVLDPLASVFLLSLSWADTPTLTSSISVDLLSPVICSGVVAPGFDVLRQNNKSFSGFASLTRPFVS